MSTARRYELTDYEWSIIEPSLPNKPRGVPRADGSVYPAARFVAEARAAGVHTCEINLEPSDSASLFDEARYGAASEAVPAWVDALLADPVPR